MHVIDAHHHFWDPAERDYPWMRGAALDPIRRRYDLSHLRARTEAAGVTETVLVQTVSDIAETQAFLATAAASDGLIAGAVGWADLTSAALHESLAELRLGPLGHFLVGIRHQVEDEPDPRWLEHPDLRRGLSAVGAAGLAYDLLIRPDQASSAIALVRELTDVTFVLDQAGKPPIATSEISGWRHWVSELSRADNVVAKVSGLVTEANWAAWSVADLRPYLDALLESFGPDRLMIGADWPVCELSAPYERVVEATTELIAALSRAERESSLSGTARNAYGLSRSRAATTLKHPIDLQGSRGGCHR